VPTTVSIGVANYPAHGEELAVIMNRADQALYNSKRSGRNRTTVSGEPTA
jgi:diguanylate cyclase (GGDEF)-like protein